MIALLTGLFAATQPAMVGTGSDGMHYLRMAEQVQSRSAVQAVAPFVWRVGTPALAAGVSSLFRVSLPHAFAWVNEVAAVLAAFLFWLWLRSHINDGLTRLVVVLFFLVSPYSPGRFTFSYPMLTDSIALLFLVGGLIGLDWYRQRPGAGRAFAVTVLVAVGCAFREVVLVVALFMLVVNMRANRAANPALQVLPMLGGLLVLALVRWWAIAEPSDYSVVGTVLYWFKWKTAAQMTLALLFVLGPAAVVPVQFWRTTWRGLAARPEWLVYAGTFVVLAWLGGSDTERILVFAAPVMLVHIGRGLARLRFARANVAFAIVATVQLIAYRVVWTRGNAGALFSFFLSRESLAASLGVYAAATAVIAFVVWRSVDTTADVGPLDQDQAESGLVHV
jgi:hypothetical protein